MDEEYRENSEFLSSVPRGTCTRFILLIDSFERVRVNLHQEKNELGLMVGDAKLADDYLRGNLPWIKSHFNGVHILWLRNSDDVVKRLEFIQGVIREMRPSNKTVSQGVFCLPGVEEVIRVGQLVKNILTIVHVRAPNPDKTKVFEIFNICVKPLFKYGIPRNKIAIGLTNIRFRKICTEDKEKALKVVAFSKMMSDRADLVGLVGTMVYSLESDDYTGQVCEMGKYPFLVSHNVQIQFSAPMSAMSGGIVVQPIMATSVINVLALTLMSEGFY